MNDSLDSILRDNPWTEMAQKLENEMKVATSTLSGSFVLERDKAILRRFGGLSGDEGSRLLLDIPPQPFIGSPKAKIWILQFNPGYSETIDSFDYLGKDSLPEHDDHKSAIVSSLRERINLLCAQYRFENNVFYALTSQFHTFKRGFRKGHERGVYLWYQESLFPRNGGCFQFVAKQKREKFCRDNIFVIEFFPYHSKTFNCNIFPFLPSFAFWRRLIHYGFRKNKIMLCHGLRSRNSITASVLASVEGFEGAISNGCLHSIVLPGEGRSTLILKGKAVAPIKGGTTLFRSFCDKVRTKYR